MFIQLKEKHHADGRTTCKQLRATLPSRLPDADVLLPRAGHLDAGAQLRARRAHRRADRRAARQRREGLRRSPSSIARAHRGTSRGAVDVHLAQVVEPAGAPRRRRPADGEPAGHHASATWRTTCSCRSARARRSRRTSGSTSKGVQYLVAVQTPQYRGRLDRRAEQTPDHLPGAAASRSSSPTWRRSRATRRPVNITHYNVRSHLRRAGQRGRDRPRLGRRRGREGSWTSAKQSLPRGTTIVDQRPGREHERRASAACRYGLIFAIVLVYLLMVVNFQSWLDPLIILMALPGALAGIVWMLFLTQHDAVACPRSWGRSCASASPPSNSILVVTFANDQRKDGRRRAPRRARSRASRASARC